LKALRYPFAAQIDAKWLAAPASMHSWPFLLGMLHWLVEIGKVCCILLLRFFHLPIYVPLGKITISREWSSDSPGVGRGS
jgi:hypothetical protein